LQETLYWSKMSSAYNDHFFVVNPFPGDTTTNMNDFIKPLARRIPNKVILHVGTNERFVAQSSC
jgi:hypothetical protein